MGEGPVVSPKADAEPGVVGSRHRRRAELLMEGTKGAEEVAEEEGQEEGRAMPKRGQDRRRCHFGAEPCVTPRVAAERDVVEGRCRRWGGRLREGTKGVGVAAEEEEVREEGEGHARRTKGQNQRCHWYDVWERSFFSILAPPDAHRVDEGRWGW